MTTKLDETIDQILAFGKRSDEFFDSHHNATWHPGESNAEKNSQFLKYAEDMHKMITPAVAVAIVKHYEKRLVKMEAESVRFQIMKQAIKESLAEQQG